MALPHFSELDVSQPDPLDHRLYYQEQIDIPESITPLKSNFFEIDFLNNKGDIIEGLNSIFFSYEKKLLGKESAIYLHFQMHTEKLKNLEEVKNICEIEVTSFNSNTTIAFIQKFELLYLNYQITQNLHDDDIQHMTYVYKILDEEISWI